MKRILYPAMAAAFAISGYALLAAGGSEQPTPRAEAGENYTSYLTNPSFESFTETDAAKVTNDADGLRGWSLQAPEGWTVQGDQPSPTLIVTADCYTDNNFGKMTTIADGKYAFYCRYGWSAGESQISQTIKNLPAGNYTLSYDWKASYANSATSSFQVKVGNSTAVTANFPAGSDGSMSGSWNKADVNFSNKEAGNVDLKIIITWVSGGSCVAFDNFTLTRTGDYSGGGDTPDEPLVGSPTEGKITHDFVAEPQMTTDLMQMLANFSKYMANNVQTISAKNSEGDAMISFKGENTLGNNEQGVRHNADMSMICAFLAKYAKDKVTLPAGLSWATVEDLAMKSLVYSYSTHKANKLYACSGNSYWGSSKGAGQWESSLWAMSVAYSAFFQWDKLSDTQKKHIEDMLVSECDYEINRSIPTGYVGDTKAEENGWEADILAATLGLFPNHANATKWFETLRKFAINSYSHSSDASNKTVIDPEYDNKTVADLYIGQNLYDDWTLQNHNLFHTSYLNVVQQELGEAALALKLFQKELYGTEKWKTNALMHNQQEVMDNVLNWLALADGELAMPNGNDWSLFLFDQITSYSTLACFLRDPNALFLENMAYKYIQARQKTTSDGSWLLRADVGGRRMGVEGHRVMMTCLMHLVLPTADMTPTKWSEFQSAHAGTKFFPCQNVIRSTSDSRFVTFSWSDGLSNYTGYIASHNPDNNKIIVPYRANNTGNFLGWYTVSGTSINASPVIKGIYETGDKHFVMNGELNTNDTKLNNRFAIYSTPANAVIYLDLVKASADATVTKEQGGLMAISMDEFTNTERTFYSEDVAAGQTLDGLKLTKIASDWANIDNELGFVALGNKGMAFGDRGNNNSIMTAKIYPLFSDASRSVKKGDVVDARNVIYYTSVDAAATKALRDKSLSLTDKLPEGWNGVIAADPNGAYYMLVSNFASMNAAELKDVTLAEGAPVFSVLTTVKDCKSSATIAEQLNNSLANELRAFVKGADVEAMQDEENPEVIYVKNDADADVKPNVTILSGGVAVNGAIDVKAGETVKISVVNGALKAESATMPAAGDSDLTEGYTDVTSRYLKNASFEEDKTYSTIGSGQGYDEAYVNDVAPIDSNVPNILPVIGWTNATEMNSTAGNRPYRRMYSMPYSTEYPCVSVAGNYAASCSPMIGANVGERCLTVLNSWADGTNKLTQTVTLPEGEYRVLVNARYESPNQMSNDGQVVTASNGNINTSLIGVKYSSTEDYAYPTNPNVWETLVYDLTVDKDTPVTLSLGYSTSSQAGAANNTLLYLDNVKLYKKGGESGVKTVSGDKDEDIYTIGGVLVHKAGDANSQPLPAGIYVKGNHKIIVK